MVRHHHLGQITAFGKTRRHRKHNPVTERNHGRLHIFIGISTFGNRIRPRQERRLEIIVHELERNGDMRNSEFFAMKFSEGNFTVVVIASVIERDSKGDFVSTVIEQGRAIHAARQNQQGVFHVGS